MCTFNLEMASKNMIGCPEMISGNDCYIIKMWFVLEKRPQIRFRPIWGDTFYSFLFFPFFLPCPCLSVRVCRLVSQSAFLSFCIRHFTWVHPGFLVIFHSFLPFLSFFLSASFSFLVSQSFFPSAVHSWRGFIRVFLFSVGPFSFWIVIVVSRHRPCTIDFICLKLTKNPRYWA